MKKQTDKLEILRHSVGDFFSTVDDLLQAGKLTKDDREWLEKELEEMEEKLKAYKQTHAQKAGV